MSSAPLSLLALSPLPLSRQSVTCTLIVTSQGILPPFWLSWPQPYLTVALCAAVDVNSMAYMNPMLIDDGPTTQQRRVKAPLEQNGNRKWWQKTVKWEGGYTL